MEKISSRQLSLIGCTLVMDATIISVPAQITAVAKVDFWLAYLLGAAFMTVPLWMLSKISARFPDKDLYDIAVQRYPVAGRIVSLLYISFFLFILARDLRSIVDFVNVALLPMTPISVTAALVTITLIFIARGGIEMVARLNSLWQPILIIVAFMLPFILFRELQVRHVLPSLEYGAIPALKGGWYAVSYIGEIVLLPFIFEGRTFHFRTGLSGMLLGVLLVEISHWTLVLTLGVLIPIRTLYPMYELVRQIRLTDFLDRFDLPIVGIWLPAMIVRTSFCLFAVCHGINRIFPSISGKELSTPFGVLGFVCCFWLFRNTMNVFLFNGVWTAIALVFEWLIPLALFVFLRPKRSTSAIAQ